MNVQDDFYFDSPEELSVEQLFLYFRYITSKEELYDYEQWYNKEQDLYIFPAEYMVTTLKQYMDVDCGEDLRKESYYNAETGNIEVQIFSGFGGHRDVSLRSKSKQGNLLTLIADFYNDESKENGSCYCSVRYTIEERADAFVYRKIEKAKVAGGTDFG